MFAKRFFAYIEEKSEGIVTGLLCGVLLSVVALSATSIFWASHRPSPTPGIAIEDNKQFGQTERQQIVVNNEAAQNFAPSNPKELSIKPKWPNENGGDDKNNGPSVSRWTKSDVMFAAFFSGCLVIVGILQWCSMQKQATYMRQGLRVTLKAARAAKKSADVAEKTVEQMRLEQRAWLNITAEITQLEIGHPLGVDFILSNSGMTPAMIRKVRIGNGIPSDYRITNYDEIVADHAIKPWASRQNTVAPNGIYTVHLERGHVVTKDEFDSLTPEGTGVLWLLVTVQYSDFADGRESQALLLYSRLTDRFQQHEHHNYME